MNLYELNNNYRNLLEVLNNEEFESNEELKEVINNSLNEIDDNINVKIENTIKYIKNIEAEAKAFKEEEERLSKRRKVLENKTAYLKQYIRDYMIANEIKSKECGLFKVSIRNSESVNIVDEEKLPDSCKVVKYVADKKTIKELIKMGGEIGGAELVQNKSLNIK